MTESRSTQQVGVLGGLAFLVELVMFGLLAVSGWRLGGSVPVSAILAVVFVAVVVVVWGRWMAPQSARRLPGGARAVVATALFVVTAAVALLADISPFVVLPFALVGAAVFVATRDA